MGGQSSAGAVYEFPGCAHPKCPTPRLSLSPLLSVTTAAALDSALIPSLPKAPLTQACVCSHLWKLQGQRRQGMLSSAQHTMPRHMVSSSALSLPSSVAASCCQAGSCSVTSPSLPSEPLLLPSSLVCSLLQAICWNLSFHMKSSNSDALG